MTDGLPPKTQNSRSRVFELHGYVNHQVEKRRESLANAFAHSYIANQRNLESHWYGPWSVVLHSLVFDIPSAIVVPQFTLWFTPESLEGGEDMEDSEFEDGPALQDGPTLVETQCANESVSDNEGTRQKNSNKGDEEPQPTDGNPSICTVAAPLSKASVPDFSVLLLELDLHPEDTEPDFCAGLKVSVSKVGAIVENKSTVSRTSDLDSFQYNFNLINSIDEAKEGLFEQAAHVFLNYPDHNAVIAIAAAGAEWTYAALRRDHVQRRMNQIAERDSPYQLRTRPGAKPEWTKPTKLGSADSNKNFEAIHKYLLKKAKVGMAQMQNA